MEDLLKTIFDKISSYNIFNYLFPGAVFCFLSEYILSVKFLNDEWIKDIVICYFIGMILSRIGSLIVETIMKHIKYKSKKSGQKEKLLSYASYADYKEASENTPSILILSEVNNTYRTFVAVFLCLLILKIYISISNILVNYECYILCDIHNIKDWLLLGGLLILFICSFVKQTGYVRKSVESYIKRK